MKEVILGLVRHGLTTAGGSLVTAGYATGSDLDLLVGAVITILGVGFSIGEKVIRKRLDSGKLLSMMFSFCLVGATLSMTACAGLKDATEVDCLDRVKTVERAITAGYESAASLYQAGIIDEAGAKKAMKALDAANAAADQAVKMCPVDNREASDAITNAAGFILEANSIFGGQ